MKEILQKTWRDDKNDTGVVEAPVFFFFAHFYRKKLGIMECDTQRGVTEIAWTGCVNLEIPDVHWV